MKKILCSFSILLMMLLALPALITAQGKKISKFIAIKNIMEQQRFVFSANMANPTGMRAIFLTPPYLVQVSKDTIQSDLPFFGRAFSAPMNPTEGGIRFTSTDFEYAQSYRKKSWTITIRPKDVTDVQRMILQVFDNGKANLQVTSNNRQPISFNGQVKARENR